MVGAAPALNYGELRSGSIVGTSQGSLPTERAYRLLATVKAGVAARSGLRLGLDRHCAPAANWRHASPTNVLSSVIFHAMREKQGPDTVVIDSCRWSRRLWTTLTAYAFRTGRPLLRALDENWSAWKARQMKRHRAHWSG
ncbi:hypothetical protein MPL3356_340170 [Mesorhizobium plurifarium]|uniref:Uncharacterized protein n=1 Tax=Mesorhizobium plurifarium TaxID=69974 RepID=A0A090DVM3_MESPL|nr:hypothetical protein MPL3356_340170 [Mesorhizobium plurifarium]